jgi:hypothetical protein
MTKILYEKKIEGVEYVEINSTTKSNISELTIFKNTGITVQRSQNLMIIKKFRVVIVVWKITKTNKNAEKVILRIY